MRTLLLGVVMLVFVSAASGAARPVSPAPGAVTTSHPTFVWQLGPNEITNSVYIASSPQTTPAGEFFMESVVDTGFLFDSRTTWAPARALFAGQHWWNVSTLDQESFATAYSAVSSFTVASEIRLLRVRITRESWTFSPDRLQVDVRWLTNVREVVVEAAITHRGRRVGRVRRSHRALISRDPDSETLSWTRPRRVRTGSRLSVQIRVIGGGRSALLRRIVRAP